MSCRFCLPCLAEQRITLLPTPIRYWRLKGFCFLTVQGLLATLTPLRGVSPRLPARLQQVVAAARRAARCSFVDCAWRS